MHRFTKIIALASIGSALSAAPALAAECVPSTERFADRVHRLAIQSPKALTVDVPMVATPALSTPSVRTPTETLCAGMAPIGLPATAHTRSELVNDVNTPSSTWDINTCSTVPSASVASIAVGSKSVDVASTTVALPVSVDADDSGAESSTGDGTIASADHSGGRHAEFGVSTNASDINVDVAPHL
jgi:hypothetical protein